MAENAAYDLAADPCGCPAFGERCFSSLLLDGITEISGFMQIMGTAFPFLAAMVCSRSIQLEEDNHFQTFLGTTKRSKALFAKCAVLHIQSLAAVLLAIGNFAVGYYVLFYAETAGRYGDKASDGSSGSSGEWRRLQCGWEVFRFIGSICF